MFRPGAPIDEVERDVEAVITDLVHELGELSEADPEPIGAEERAYIKAFSNLRANRDKDQAAMLTTAINRPNLAESLHYLNRQLDEDDLDPKTPSGIIGIVVRLAMDGLWVSDLIDATRFTSAQRERLVAILTRMTYITDEQLEELMASDGRRPAGGKHGATAAKKP